MPLINVVSCLMFWTVETNEMLNESAMQGESLKRSLKTGEALQTCLCFDSLSLLRSTGDDNDVKGKVIVYYFLCTICLNLSIYMNPQLLYPSVIYPSQPLFSLKHWSPHSSVTALWMEGRESHPSLLATFNALKLLSRQEGLY